jgi:hypothetical protein
VLFTWLTSVAVRLTDIVRPRYLVYQTRAEGLADEEPVYAEVFYRRASAEKAQKAANERMRVVTRRYAVMVTLPLDKR